MGWRRSGRIIDSSSETATRRKAKHNTTMAGPLSLLTRTTSWENGSVQRRIRLTNHGFWPEHDTWNTGWDESHRDDTSHWSFEPEYSAVSPLDHAIQDGSVDGTSSVSESDDGDMHAAMSAMNSAARTLTEARGLLNRVRNARGYYPVVGLADKKRAERCQDWRIRKRQGQEHERKERKNVEGQVRVKRTSTLLHL